MDVRLCRASTFFREITASFRKESCILVYSSYVEDGIPGCLGDKKIKIALDHIDNYKCNIYSVNINAPMFHILVFYKKKFKNT